MKLKQVDMIKVMFYAALTAFAVIFGFTMYKLVVIGWFGNVTLPTLIFYGLITLFLLLGFYNIVVSIINSKKETKK